MKDFQEFLNWEKATQDSIDFKRIYADMTGDTLAGLVLSQIVYWHLPSKNGGSKLRVQKEGEKWIACTRAEWWESTRLTPRQIDRVLTILEKKKLIIKKLFKFSGSPTVHIRINFDVFIMSHNSHLANPLPNPYTTEKKEIAPNSDFTNPLNGNVANGEMEIDKTLKSLTKNTTETTTEKKEIAPKERDRLFDGVSLVCFGIKADDPMQKEALKANSPRIGKLVKFLNSVAATPEKLWVFNNWYCNKYPGATVPSDLAKFSRHYNDFTQQAQASVVQQEKSNGDYAAIQAYANELRLLKG